MPADYARIFQFENFDRTKKRVLEEKVEGAEVSVTQFTRSVNLFENVTYHCLDSCHLLCVTSCHRNQMKKNVTVKVNVKYYLSHIHIHPFTRLEHM